MEPASGLRLDHNHQLSLREFHVHNPLATTGAKGAANAPLSAP